ncbi:MAG: GNAT family N-acetyltransferase [Oscillochloris sp.]|nr:GNAT family N-acetyltransferase [Oscillochloris sp.]
MISGRLLGRDEIKTIWTIDRSEVITALYTLENGALVLRPEYHNVRGWEPGKAEQVTPGFEACYDRGGWFYGLFDHERLIGAAVLENCWIGATADLLQLDFLHLSHGYRGRGLGKRLFMAAATEARRRGARRMYISATPSEHTIGFYTHLGCVLAPEPDPELFALEPDDIHLEYALGSAMLDA